MSYFPDLSPYSYTDGVPADVGGSFEMVNVGWLDSAHAFPIGKVSIQFANALISSAFQRTNLTRGYHECEFCDQESPIRISKPGGTQHSVLGMSEIAVEGPDGVIYMAPTLIVHYVNAHHYRPPIDFQRAVIRTAGKGKERTE
jgi:hypothetical protein